VTGFAVKFSGDNYS